MERAEASGVGLRISFGKRSFWIGFLLLMLISLPVAGSEGAVKEEVSTPVIVMLLPMSGDLAPVGRQLMESATLAGSDLGLRVESLDEGDSPGETLRALDELAGRDDIVAVIGPLGRRRAPMAARKATEMGLPLVVYSPQGGVERLGDRVFRARPDAQEQSRTVATYLVEREGIRTLGILSPRTEYGREFTAAMVEAFSRAGGQVRAYSSYGADTTDFRPALEVLVGKRAWVGRGRQIDGRSSDRFGTIPLPREGEIGFEALVILDFHDRVARILPFLPGVGIQTGAGGEGTGVQLVGLSGWRGDGLHHAGMHALGAVFFDTFGGETEGGQAEEFFHRFQEQFRRSPTTAEAEIYDLVGMIGSGIRARQPGESWADAALARLREPTAYPGVTGSWSFDEEGAPVRYLRGYRVIEGGRWVPLGGVAP